MTLLPDAQRLQNLLERARLYAKSVSISGGSVYEDAGNSVEFVKEYANRNKLNVEAELYFKGRQAGRVAMARQMLKILGVPHRD